MGDRTKTRRFYLTPGLMEGEVGLSKGQGSLAY